MTAAVWLLGASFALQALLVGHLARRVHRLEQGRQQAAAALRRVGQR